MRLLQEGVKTENDHINLKVAGQDGSVVQFKIKRHTPLSKLMKAYCERQVRVLAGRRSWRLRAPGRRGPGSAGVRGVGRWWGMSSAPCLQVVPLALATAACPLASSGGGGPCSGVSA